MCVYVAGQIQSQNISVSVSHHLSIEIVANHFFSSRMEKNSLYLWKEIEDGLRIHVPAHVKNCLQYDFS